MINKILPFLAISYFSFLSIQIYPQITLKGINSDSIFDLAEVGVLIMETKDCLEVKEAMPEENRPNEYKSVDIRKGDKIMMINGKRVKKVKECKVIYDNLPVNGEFKLGLTRGDKMLLVTIKKADPESLPVIKRVIIKSDGKEGDIKAGSEKRIIKRNR